MGHRHYDDTLHVTGQHLLLLVRTFISGLIADKVLEISYISLDLCKYKLKS